MSKPINDQAVKATAPATMKRSTRTPQLDEDTRRAIARKAKALTLIMPTEEEDAAITKAALSDPDNPPATGAELGKLQPARRPRGRPALDVTKVPTSIRFDSLVLDAFKAFGPGWQTRINEVLLQYLIDTRQLIRFHATVQATAKEQRKPDEFLVVARDAVQAKEKLKQHLLASGREEAARERVVTVDVGNAAVRDLPVIM